MSCITWYYVEYYGEKLLVNVTYLIFLLSFLASQDESLLNKDLFYQLQAICLPWMFDSFFNMFS